jgi:hypothetical protein
MWLILIGWYPFGWIAVVERRIKRWSDGSDRRIPLRLSDWIWAVRSWSDERDSEGREAHRARLGFRRGIRRGAQGVDGRRRSGDFWRWGEGERGSACHGGVGGEVGGVSGVLQRGGEATGVRRGHRVLQFFVYGEFLRAKPFGRRSEDAHEREGEIGTTNGWRRPRVSAKSCGYACSYVGLRQEIAPAWRRIREREKGGRGEGAEAFL